MVAYLFPVAVVYALAVAACGGVEIGDTRDEVIAAAGEPMAVMKGGAREYLDFRDGLSVVLENGRVVSRTMGTSRPRTAAPTAAAPRPASVAAHAPDPSRQADNLAIHEVIESWSFLYRVLNDPPVAECRLVMCASSNALEVTGIPATLLKGGQTTLSVRYGVPFVPMDPTARTVAITDRRTQELYDGLTEDAFRNRVMFGDNRNATTVVFLQWCKAYHRLALAASPQGGEVVFARKGSVLSVSGLPATLFRSGQTTVTIDMDRGPLYDGSKDAAQFRNSVWW